MSTDPGRRGGTLGARLRGGAASSTTGPATQHRVPLPAFARWLLTADVGLPVPLTTTYAATFPVGDELVELTAPRLAGSPTPGARAGVDPALERVLDECRPYLSEPDVVLFALRTADGVTRTVAGLVRATDAVLLDESPEDVVLRQLPAVEVADAVARRLPQLRGAPMRPLTVSAAALGALADAGTPTAPAAERVVRTAGLDAESLAAVWRVQADVRAHGMLGAIRPDGLGGDGSGGGPGFADWYEGPAGSVLKHRTGEDRFDFSPATRESLAAALASALRAAVAAG